MGVYGRHPFGDELQAVVQAVKVAAARDVVLCAFLCHSLIVLLSLQQFLNQQHVIRSGQHLPAAVGPVSGLHFLRSVVPSGQHLTAAGGPVLHQQLHWPLG